MSAWATMTLRDAGVVLIDCVHKTPPARDEGYPYIAIPQMKDGRIEFDTARRISEADFLQWTKKARPRLHDVVLSRRTNPGVTATFGSDVDFALGQNLVLLRADGTSVLPELLRWLVSTPAWWEQIRKFNNVGAVFDSLRCADVPNFELPIPAREDQKSIVAVLGALEEKIETNRRMNSVFESFVRALFRSWFVDFGPVRAKVDGRLTDLLPDLHVQFPNGLTEGRLGVQPEGWKVSTIGQEVDVIGGNTPSTSVSDYWGEVHAWATPKDLSNLGSPVLFETARSLTDEGLAKVSSGLLPANAVLLSSRAPIGYLAISMVPMAINQGFVAMVCRKTLGPRFAYFWSAENLDRIKSRANGSTFQEISKGSFKGIEVLVPPAPIASAFEDVAGPMFDRIALNAQQSRTLAALRDFLLPRLMSGAIRVQDAEALVEEVA